MESVLKFNKYKVLEQVYKQKLNIESDYENIVPSITVEVGTAKSDIHKGLVKLGVEIGDEELTSLDFYIKVKVAGFFEVDPGEQVLTEEDIDSLYEINAVSILFPYLRSIVSELSSKGDESPVVLPPVNVVALVENIKKEIL